VTIAFPSCDGRPAVRFTARCPCGHPDADWIAALVPGHHPLVGTLVSVVQHEIHCSACGEVGEVAA
jgi:hypothetical protein